MVSDSDPECDWFDDEETEPFREEESSSDEEELEGYTRESLWEKYKQAVEQRKAKG